MRNIGFFFTFQPEFAFDIGRAPSITIIADMNSAVSLNGNETGPTSVSACAVPLELSAATDEAGAPLQQIQNSTIMRL